MKYQRGLRAVVYAASLCVVICTAGCSASFCGIRPGGSEELTFSCGEEIPDEALSSGQPEEQEDLGSSVHSGDSDSGLRESEDAALEAAGNEAVRTDGRVNINLAGMEELMTLNGIGETRARAIVEYRSQNGAFTKAEDIMQVPGIKEGIFSKIRHQIAVD